jgi:hypothetical protein
VEHWAFVADWTDPSSGVRWTYQLFAYLVPGAPLEVEMVSRRRRSTLPAACIVSTQTPTVCCLSPFGAV